MTNDSDTTTPGSAALANIHVTVDDDGVAMALIDRRGESMNTLGVDVARDLGALVERVENDDSIRALVLGSAKPDNFVAGADIRWLASLDDPATATELLSQAHDVFARLERLHTEQGKPVVAAIHGPALGGGCELALACGIRICSDEESRTQLGQPEVKLGILPGAGGTQRLPRLIGVAAALDLMLTGRSVRPRSAYKMGLVDETCPKEILLDVARRRAFEAIDAEPEDTDAVTTVKSWLSPRHLQQLALEDNPLGRKVLFSKAEDAMLAETKGNYPAPKAILRVVRTGVEEGIEAGYAAELDEFGKLVVSPEAAALMQIFFDSQAAKGDSGVDSDAAPRPVDKVGILGGGLMGAGIASVNTTTAGIRTRINEIDDDGVRRGLAHVNRNISERVKRRRLDARKAEKVRQLITGGTDYSGFSNVDVVIEAVFEDIDLKHTVLRDTEAVTSSGTIFASNTSSLPITRIAEASEHPETVIGMHYFSPVEKMPLLEVIVTGTTADWVTATCVALGKKQGKTVIVVNDGPGFYTTRVLGPYTAEIAHLISEGVRIEDIDRAMTEWGFPVGPATLADEVGLDVGAKIAKIMEEAFGERMTAPPAFTTLVEAGYKGRKNGKGFYRYEDGKRAGVDDSVYGMLGGTADLRLSHRTIQDRMALHFVNEAARCLEEGILRSARDGDIGAVFGLGFPPFRGGPFTYVDQVGAATVVERLENLASAHGDRYQPAEILRTHAAAGTKFRK